VRVPCGITWALCSNQLTEILRVMANRFDYHGWSLAPDFLVLSDITWDVDLGPTTLLLAIDDTGDPATNDPNYPVFGLGGCAVLAGQYSEAVRRPWASMKGKYFSGPLNPLHAAELRSPSTEQIAALNAFFENSQFFRAAALITDQLAITGRVARVELVSLVLTRLLERILRRVPCSKVAILLDSSERLNPELARVFEGLTVNQSLNGASREIPTEFLEITKSMCEPALEVADFVMHTAGRAARRSRNGKRLSDLPDFTAVFATSPPEWSEFELVSEVGFAAPA
jgi:hypothetical protein